MSSRNSNPNAPQKRAKIPSDFVDKIKKNLNIIDIVGEHVVLKKSGSNFGGLCPFHSERTPSFSVSETKQLYHCYGCKAGGDLISFFQDLHGLNFGETLEELAQKAGLKLPESFKQQSEAQSQSQTAFKLNRFAASWFRKNLSSHASALNYLRERHVSDELNRYFYMGSSIRSWDALGKQLAKAKAPLPVAEQLGLLRKSTRSDSDFPYFDLFRERLVFPILDLRGRVTGFGGRLLPSASDGPKYLNSPESRVFQKSKSLFGLYQAKKYIREMDSVILVEGYFDVMALVHAGIRNVVATCGTALTEQHLEQMTRFTKKVILFFDSDRAGQQATEKAMVLGLQKGIVLHGASLPQGKDPDEFLFQPGETSFEDRIAHFKSILKESKPLIDSSIDLQIEESKKNAESKTEALKRISAWVKEYRDPIGREVRLQKIESELGIRRELMLGGGPSKAQPARPRQPVNRPQNPQPQNPNHPPQAARTQPSEPFSTNERLLLKGWVLAEEFAEFWSDAGRKLPPKLTISDLFGHISARKYVAATGGGTEQGTPQPSQAAESFLSNVGFEVRSAISEALVGGKESVQISGLKSAFRALALRLWARFSQELKASIAVAEANNDKELQGNLLKDYLDVQRKMKELNSFL